MEVALLVSLTPHDIRRVEVCVQLVIIKIITEKHLAEM